MERTEKEGGLLNWFRLVEYIVEWDEVPDDDKLPSECRYTKTE